MHALLYLHPTLPSSLCIGRLSLRDQRLSTIGAPKAGRIVNYQPQLIPLQVIPNGVTIRPASSFNFVQSVRPRAISPPTVQSHPYWAESTLSLLPPVPPSALANQSTSTHQNPRTSLYRKTALSNADLRRPNRLVRQRNSLVVDGEPLIRDHRATQRPQSVFTPLPLANGSGEACSNPVEDFGTFFVCCCMLYIYAFIHYIYDLCTKLAFVFPCLSFTQLYVTIIAPNYI